MNLVLKEMLKCKPNPLDQLYTDQLCAVELAAKNGPVFGKIIVELIRFQEQQIHPVLVRLIKKQNIDDYTVRRYNVSIHRSGF